MSAPWKREWMAGWMGLLLLAAGGAPLAATQGDVFEGLDGARPCVAYRTMKEMFWFTTVEVIGRTCGVTARLEGSAAGADRDAPLRLVLEIPAGAFDSGNGRRDAHVAELLGGPTRQPLRFRGEPLRGTVADALRPGETMNVSGVLELHGGTVPVTFEVRRPASGAPVLEARLRTTFAALGIAVPSVGPGGIIAAPGEAVELLGRFPLEGLRRLIDANRS